MIIDKISVAKFHGFKDVGFELGTHITVIAGQNGTQKTTILGLLSQPFSITDKDNPMRLEKPLCGGTFRSLFSEKFKFSDKFDKAGEHEWTLYFKNSTDPYTVESMLRDKKTGDRSKGSGYIQLPVIYLSLKRLLPIAEDERLKEDVSMKLTSDEFDFYTKWHNKILILTRDKDKIIETNYLTSTHKQTLGATTDYYDWKTNSAGQDNIGKILLAILSFKRLKDNYSEKYKGGILAIDELDATFYSGSQLHLLDALNHFASKYNIQIIFTTHSLTIIEKACELQEDKNRKNQVKVMFLEKLDNNVTIKENVKYNYIKNLFNVSLTGFAKIKKIDVFTEDKEASIFVKALLKSKKSNLKFINVSLGCDNIIELSSKKIPSFIFPNSIIFLDGDVRKNLKKVNRISKLKNILLLPTEKSPEQILAQFLNDLSDTDELWNSIDETFRQQYCFQHNRNDEIQNDRQIAKKWFNTHLNVWGINATKIINPWIKENQEIVDVFVVNFIKLYNEFANKLGVNKL